MFIRSERLFLRPAWPEDWAELHALIDDESVVRNLVPCFASSARDTRHPHFLVTLPGASGARLIGCVGLVEEEGQTELGYWIAQQYWNNGYATEAVRALLALAPTLGHRRILARHFMDNLASARVLAKAGFRPTGEGRLIRSAARQATEPTLTHAIDLYQPADCDGPEDGGFSPMRTLRAA